MAERSAPPFSPPLEVAPTPGRRRGLRAAVLACAVLVPVLVVTALVLGGEPDATAPELPERLLGLPAQRGGAAREVAAGLTDRLAAEPTVSSVAVGVYGGPEETLVVLRLVPREPLDDADAADLTARVLGAAPRSGGRVDVTTESADERAVITCAGPPSAAATCVSVEPDAALVVLGTATGIDPLALTQQVRDELRAGPGSSN